MSFAISSKAMSEIRNRKARTGRQDVPIQDIIEADLAVQYDRGLESARLGQQIKQQDIDNQIRRDELAAQKSAAAVSGAIQLGSTAATGYMAYKAFATPAAVAAGTATSGVGTATTAYATSATGGTTATALGYTPSYAATGTGATATTGSTLGSTVASYALPAAAVLAGVKGWTGMRDAQKGTGGGIGSKIATKITPWNDAGTTGAVMNIVTAPLTILAGAIDFVEDILDSIICAELHRQGYITKVDLIKIKLYRDRYIRPIKYDEYLKWASPVVSLMKSSQMASVILAPIWKCWARAMIAKVDKNVKASWFDNMILNLTHKYTDFRINRRAHDKLFRINR